METGKGTGDGPGDEELINTPGGPSSVMMNLGKGTQEDRTTLSTSGLALISWLHPKICQPTNILLHTNVTQEYTLSKDKGIEEDMLVSNSAHGDMTQNKETSTNRPLGAFRDGLGITPSTSEEHSITSGESSSSKESLTAALQGIVVHIADPDLAQPNLEVVPIVAPAAPAQSNVAMVVTFPGVAPAEPNIGPIVAVCSVISAQINTAVSAPLVKPNVAVNVPTSGLALPQPSVALLVVTAVVAPIQPLPAPNVVPPTGTTVAPSRVDIAQLNVAAVAPVALALVGQNLAVNVAGLAAQQNVAPAPTSPQQNVAPVVARAAPAPAPAPAQANAAAVVGPPGAPPALPNVIDINGGLTRSQLRPLRTFESGQEGNLWPKL